MSNNERSLKYSFQDKYSAVVKGCCGVKEYRVESSYMLEQLQVLTQHGFLFFLVSMKECFGLHHDKEVIRVLYRKAQVKSAELNPPIEVVSKKIEGKEAAYDHQEKKILLWNRFVGDARYLNYRSAELLAALAEEFGHHIEHLLSEEYSHVGRSKQGDVGAKFSYMLITINRLEIKRQIYAKVNGNDIAWEYRAKHKALRRHVDALRQVQDDSSSERYSFFKDTMKEGHGFGHHQIEEDAFLSFFMSEFKIEKDPAKEIVSKIYFGNWMRDYSQIIDPKLIRPLSNLNVALASTKFVAMGKAIFYKEINSINDMARFVDPQDLNFSHYMGDTPPYDLNIIHDMDFVLFPDNNNSIEERVSYKEEIEWRADDETNIFEMSAYSYTNELKPILWSREIATRAVGYLAIEKFIKPQTGDMNKENYRGIFKKLEEEYIEFTPDLLGMYRPDEHIDNPRTYPFDANKDNHLLNSPDENANNRGFVGVPYVGSANKEDGEMDVGRYYGMKNYIRTEADSKKFSTKQTAYELLRKKLIDASKDNFHFEDSEKVNMKAMIDFGAALHIVEDFFGHTNYAEIALIKLGYDRVYPWVDQVVTAKGRIFNYDTYARMSPEKAIEYIKTVDPVIKTGHIPRGGGKVAQYIPLTTGTFSQLDMIASVLPVVYKLMIGMNEIGKFEFTPGSRGLADAFMMDMCVEMDRTLEHFIDNIPNPSDYGVEDIDLATVPKFEKLFEAYLAERDIFYEEINYDVANKISPEHEEEFYKRLGEIKAKLNFGLYALVDMAINKVNDIQQNFYEQIDRIAKRKNRFDFGMGTDPTHTQIAKDDPHKYLHKLAAKLAIRADEIIGKKMFKVWKKQMSIDELLRDIDMIFRHPVESTWQDELVKEWAEVNPEVICKSMTPTVVIDSLIAGIKEYDEFTDKLFEMATGVEGSMGEYLVKGKGLKEAVKLTLKEIRKDVDELKEFLNKAMINREDKLTIGTHLAEKMNLDRDKLLALLEGDPKEVEKYLDKVFSDFEAYLTKNDYALVELFYKYEKENIKELIHDGVSYFKEKLKETIIRVEEMEDIHISKAPEKILNTSTVGKIMQEYNPNSSLYAKIKILKNNGIFLIQKAKLIYPKYQGVYYKPEKCTNKFQTYMLYFETNEDFLQPNALNTLKGMMMSVERRGDRKIHLTIEGYADERGDEDYNLDLSERRAEKVKSYFVKNGWNPKAMSTVGFGEDNPVSMESHKENRRVEIYIEKLNS